jgi:hypothetical protein
MWTSWLLCVSPSCLPPLYSPLTFPSSSSWSQTRQAAVVENQRTSAIIAASSLLLLNVNVEGKIVFCEGNRSSFLSAEKAQRPVLGRSFSDVWEEGELQRGVTKVLDGEEEVVEVEVEDGEHFLRYRVRFPSFLSSSQRPFHLFA